MATKELTYFEGVGRRKTSSARVRITPSSKKSHTIIVNDKPLADFFDVVEQQNDLQKPLSVLGTENFEISIRVYGGGVAGQVGASQLGLARALMKYDETLKKQLKDNGYLTRDPRVKERKKPGLRKARRSPQWSKR